MIMNSINITSVEKIAQYQLRLVFDDGTVREVDFKDFLAQSHHPDIRAYLEESKFDAYHLEFGELVWGDFDLCFPIIDLYHNRILHPLSMEAAA
jgi:hypothetical protein